jgi:hypothetical protein
MALAPTQSTREAFAARQATIATALVLVVMNLGAAAIQRAVHGDIRWMHLGHAILAALVALLLWSRPKASIRWSVAGVIALALPLLPLLWLLESRAIAAQALWRPITIRKAMLLAVALVTPSSAAALALIGLFLMEWLLWWQRYELWTYPIVRDMGEPWLTLLYFAGAVSLLGLRSRNRKLERRLTDTELEAQTLREVMQIGVAIRDRVSTPLQNLELSVAALKARHPEERVTLERMERSIRKLTDLRPLSEGNEEAARLRALLKVGEELQRLKPG